MNDDLREHVRERYAEAARRVLAGRREAAAETDEGDAADAGCGCGTGGCCEGDAGRFGKLLYASDDREQLPEAAVLASLGCGDPTAVAELREGETVLDLGSGGGIDVLLSAKRVGPTGRAYGLDMTEEMLALALRNRDEAGARNVEFLKGHIEDVPLPAATVDVVISNCVINLSSDKPAVFREIARVLKPGGRIGISDVVADDGLSPEERETRGSFVGCIAGALSFSEYREGLERHGLEDVSITPTHSVGDGMYSAIVRARKPARHETASERPAPAVVPMRARGPELPVHQASCC